MLVISRRRYETIVIGEGPDRIEVTVTRCEQGRVRLGFKCPRHIEIWRSELLERIAEVPPLRDRS